jgi:hypothetical protein
MENKEYHSFSHKKLYMKDLPNDKKAINPNLADNLKDDIISYSYKNSSSLVQSSLGEFNENYYTNFMNELFGNEEHLAKSLCISPPIKPRTTNKIISGKKYLNKCEKKDSRRSFFNSKIRFIKNIKSPDKSNKRSRFMNHSENSLNKNDMIILSDNVSKIGSGIKKMKNRKKSSKEMNILKCINNISYIQNVENDCTSEKKGEKYVLEEEKKKNIFCCIKC